MRDKIEALGVTLEMIASWMFFTAPIGAVFTGYGALAVYLCVLMMVVFIMEQVITWWEERGANTGERWTDEAA